MLTYLKPLRRTIGVLTLGLACALLSLWVWIEIDIKYDSDPLIDSAAFMFLIITPLTLLSAWLLLSKPRAGKA